MRGSGQPNATLPDQSIYLNPLRNWSPDLYPANAWTWHSRGNFLRGSGVDVHTRQDARYQWVIRVNPHLPETCCISRSISLSNVVAEPKEAGRYSQRIVCKQRSVQLSLVTERMTNDYFWTRDSMNWSLYAKTSEVRCTYKEIKLRCRTLVGSNTRSTSSDIRHFSSNKTRR